MSALPAGCVGTGVYATQEQADRLTEAMRTPFIIVGGVGPSNPKVMCHEMALAAGLPEITGYYGMWFETREFIRSGE